MLLNRLRKRGKHLRKWARRNDVSCYRVYDRDIPEFPLIVDLYADSAHISLFDRAQGEEGPAPLAEEEIVATVCEAFSIPSGRIFVKSRRRQTGGSQYERVGDQSFTVQVTEGGLQFHVNLSDYLDTGLFLDHRDTRARIRNEAQGQRFLNLFAYTGSFSVYAAAGGATHTTTVDMSKTYLDWAKENMRLNGYTERNHYFIRDDVFQFLKDPRRVRETYDLIVLDPPTFSRSKKMVQTLDVQRDHVDLINRAMSMLSPKGSLYFSNNLKSFKLDELGLDGEVVEELTPKSIPEDFRNKRIHRCWKIISS